MQAATKRKSTELSAEQAEFVEAWTLFFAAFRRARGRVAAQPDGELTISQHQVLMALVENDEMRVGELALAAGIAAPTATRMLDRLEQEGLIERHGSTSDRRAVAVTLTPAGEDLLESKRTMVSDKMLRIYEALGAEDRPHASSLLRALAAAIGEE